MKSLRLDTLSNAVRHEPAPDLQVADAVMRTLSTHRQAEIHAFRRPLLWMSLGSSALAASLVVAALLTWWQADDAMNEILHVVTWALP